MGGGTPLIEANRVGCDVLGFDINPMAAWIVREEIEHLDIGCLPLCRRSAARLARAELVTATAQTARVTATRTSRSNTSCGSR